MNVMCPDGRSYSHIVFKSSVIQYIYVCFLNEWESDKPKNSFSYRLYHYKLFTIKKNSGAWKTHVRKDRKTIDCLPDME